MGELTNTPVPFWLAFTLIVGALLVGVAITFIALTMWIAAFTHECPAPEAYHEPMLQEQPYEPEPVAPAADADLAELHTRARQRHWDFPEPAQPEPAAPVPLLLYDASWNTVLGATGSFSVTDLEDFMASEEAKAVAHSFTTNGKRKRSKAGVR